MAGAQGLGHGAGALVHGPGTALHEHGQPDVALRAGALELYRRQCHLRAEHAGQRGPERRLVAVGGHNIPAVRRHRPEPEDGFGDDPEGAVRAREQLGQVVTGDVLYHLAAGPGDHPIGPHDGDTDQEVTYRPVRVAGRSTDPGGDDAADGRPRDHLVDREPLPGPGQPPVEGAEAGAGLGPGHQVAPGVLEDRAHAGQVDHDLS